MTGFNNNKFIPKTFQALELRDQQQPVKKSPLSAAARSKIINRSGSNYLSERTTINNPSYGPAAEVVITSSSEIVFISSQKYGKSSWERTEEPGDNHGSTGSIRQGSEWQTRTLSVGIFDNKEAVRLLLQKLESGEIKVEKKTEFKYDGSMNSFYCIPHHETAESRRLKQKTIEAFQENLEAQEKFSEKLWELTKTPSFFIVPTATIAATKMMNEADQEKIRGIKNI